VRSGAEEETGQGPVTSETVLDELIKLRQRDGISFARVKQLAPNIQKLTVTKDEARRRKLSIADAHIAAYHAIECTVERALPKPDWVHITRRTLNFAREENDLTKRQAGVRNERKLGDNKFAKLQTEAYIELAALLVSAEQSYCRTDTPLPPTKIEVGLNLSLDVEVIRDVLMLLSVDKRQAVRDALHRSLLEQLPNAQAYLRGEFRERYPDQLTSDDDATAGELLVKLLLRTMSNKNAFARTRFSYEAVYLLLYSRLRSIRQVELSAAQQAEISADHPMLIRARPDSDFSDRLTLYFYERKRAAFEQLASNIVSNEEHDWWHIDIVPGGYRPGRRNKNWTGEGSTENPDEGTTDA
jgi:hypothetical protein